VVYLSDNLVFCLSFSEQGYFLIFPGFYHFQIHSVGHTHNYQHDKDYNHNWIPFNRVIVRRRLLSKLYCDLVVATRVNVWSCKLYRGKVSCFLVVQYQIVFRSQKITHYFSILICWANITHYHDFLRRQINALFL